MSPNLILYPTFAMFALTFGVLLYMRSRRFGAVRGGSADAAFYKLYEGQEPEELRVITRNFINLFEMPTLFYVVALMIHATGQTTVWLVFWAWVYVALRYAHTFIHLTSNHVMARFGAYFASSMVLALMWASLLIQLLVSSEPVVGVVA